MNCICPPVFVVRLAAVGVATASFEVIVAVTEADVELSAWLVALTVIDVLDGRSAGAVYKPLALMVPAPVNDQVTAVFIAFVTVAVY
jgi:hypothetical protein